ncbi:MAG: hypothetical protein LC770_14615, partial [Acidobacteria bacterium]|nr:hypothetical protein [Acidobacteriota bacterium]
VAQHEGKQRRVENQDAVGSNLPAAFSHAAHHSSSSLGPQAFRPRSANSTCAVEHFGRSSHLAVLLSGETPAVPVKSCMIRAPALHRPAIAALSWFVMSHDGKVAMTQREMKQDG